MKKLYIFTLMALILLFIGTSYIFAASTMKQFEPNNTEKEFLAGIEMGKTNPDVLISTLKKRAYLIDHISHSAVANYMEALANEGMLEVIPASYYSYEDVMTSLEVVFEDRENIMKNWDVYEEHWVSAQKCHCPE